jgi:zinc-ribbon domain
MVCPTCASPIVPGVRFCAHCGTQIAAPFPQPATPYATPPPGSYFNPALAPGLRVQRHLQTAGILWCAYGAYRILRGLIGILVLRAFTFRNFGGDGGYGWPLGRGFGPNFGPFWTALLPIIAIVTVVATALAFFTGYSLLQRKPWGRVLAIVAASLSLFRPLLGTALGIYTLWLLAPSASGLEYDALADRS